MQPECVLRGHVTAVNALLFREDRQLFSGSLDGEIRAWDLPTQRTVFQNPAPPPEHTIPGVAGTSHGILSLGKISPTEIWGQTRDGTVSIYSPNEVGLGTPVATFHTGALSFCQCAALGQSITLWDLRALRSADPSAAPQPMSTIAPSPAHPPAGTCMALCLAQRDGRPLLIAGYEDASVRVYDLEAQQWWDRLALVCGPDSEERQPVLSVQCDPASRRRRIVASTAAQDLALVTFDVPAKELGLSMSVKCPNTAGLVRIRGDSLLCVTGCWDGRVRVHQTKNLNPLAVLHGHTKTVTSLAFHDDSAGGRFASGSEDTRIALWKLYPQ
ncbi:hypothetical protein PAPYR_949 [Paratrimastix pyriformis]|uniref:Uncharacterized protein n=1 Tax=Paratrimastix pyriformis TaxID=342808 RepID=A0ABQ8UU18_9EUKA|nr:hypothetical protein PAPYR_949 [Paratrimastix pyriformis]